MPKQPTWGEPEGPFSPDQLRPGDRYELDHGHPIRCAPTGGDGARNALLGGQVLIIFDPINTSSPLVKEGKFRALGYTGSRRAALHPEVPTVAELGYPGYEFSIYTGLVAPAGTPREVITRLHAALSKARGSKELRDRFVREGTEMSADDSVEQFNEFIRREVTRYTSVVKAANIKVE